MDHLSSRYTVVISMFAVPNNLLIWVHVATQMVGEFEDKALKDKSELGAIGAPPHPSKCGPLGCPNCDKKYIN